MLLLEGRRVWGYFIFCVRNLTFDTKFSGVKSFSCFLTRLVSHKKSLYICCFRRFGCILVLGWWSKFYITLRILITFSRGSSWHNFSVHNASVRFWHNFSCQKNFVFFLTTIEQQSQSFFRVFLTRFETSVAIWFKVFFSIALRSAFEHVSPTVSGVPCGRSCDALQCCDVGTATITVRRHLETQQHPPLVWPLPVTDSASPIIGLACRSDTAGLRVKAALLTYAQCIMPVRTLLEHIAVHRSVTGLPRSSRNSLERRLPCSWCMSRKVPLC